MRLAFQRFVQVRSGAVSLPRRAVSMVLALALTLLMVLALLYLGDRPLVPPRFKGRPLVLDLTPDAEPEPAQPPKAVQNPKPQPKQEAPPATHLPPPVRPPVIPDERPLPFLVLSKEDLEASDIAKLGTRGGAAKAEQLASAEPDSDQVGTAPNGEPLYAAEWYRRPTRAELSGYLPAVMPKAGWGLIACRTAPRYRVEDCVELGSSPPGSRLASAVRQAAWQFLVRPPRVGGKELTGTWVRIRIEYNGGSVE